MTTELSRKEPIARKDHVCQWCCSPIEKGTKYEYSTHVYDGDVFAWKNHLKCALIAKKLKMFSRTDEGVGTDFFIDDIREFYEQERDKDQPELHFSKVGEMVDYLIGFYNLQPPQH